MENQSSQTQPAATNELEIYTNYFDAVDSMEFSKELRKFNTDMLIKILSYSESDWINSVITSALEEEVEAKQIYSIAESIRLEYIENTVSDLELLLKQLPTLQDRQKERLNPISDYLFSCVYGIDLFDVAKELLVRYKERNAIHAESVS